MSSCLRRKASRLVQANLGLADAAAGSVFMSPERRPHREVNELEWRPISDLITQVIILQKLPGKYWMARSTHIEV